MTSIAYKQYCNISYSGGSYVCTPIKGPMSTSQTPSTVENKNRGVTKSKNGQPEKFGFSDDGNSFSLGRMYYREVLDDGSKKNVSTNGKNLKYVAPFESSFRTNSLKNIAIGKSSTNKEGKVLSYKNDNVNDVKQALRRVRNRGYVVPKKARGQLIHPPAEEIILEEQEDEDDGISIGSYDKGTSLYPKITINGEEKMKVEINSFSTFQDPGFTAFDDRDGDLTPIVQVGGIYPKMSIVGTYIITYSVTNSLGHHDVISRIVDVVSDKHSNLSPNIVILGDNPYRIQPGIYKEYKDPGVTASQIKEGDITHKIKTYGIKNIDMDNPGRYYIKYAVSDRIGNYSESYREVIIDAGRERNYMAIFFNVVLDKDENSLLSIDEVEKGLNLLKIDISQEVLLLLLKTFSKKYENKLDYSEFLTLIRWLYDNYQEEFVSVRKYIDATFPIEQDITDYPSYYKVNIQNKQKNNSQVYLQYGVGPLRSTYNNSFDEGDIGYTNTPVSKISNKSPSMKMSSFMANHLRNRIDGCDKLCDGLATTVVDTFRTGTCTNNHLLESLILLNLECVDNISYMRIVRHDNKNVWALNNNSTYIRQYGVYNGKYNILDVPIYHPIAVLNKGKEHLITLTGNESNKFSKLVNGVTYDFYYGNVVIDVMGDFNTMSLYCYNHGYMGGKDMLRYTDTCNISNTKPDIVIPITADISQTSYDDSVWYDTEGLPTYIVLQPEIVFFIPENTTKNSKDFKELFSSSARAVFTKYTVSPALPNGLTISNDGSIIGTLFADTYKGISSRSVHIITGHTSDGKKQSYNVIIRITTSDTEIIEPGVGGEPTFFDGFDPRNIDIYPLTTQTTSGRSTAEVGRTMYGKYYYYRPGARTLVYRVEALDQPLYGEVKITNFNGKPYEWQHGYDADGQKVAANGWPYNDVIDTYSLKVYGAQFENNAISAFIETINYTITIAKAPVQEAKIVNRSIGYGVTKATFYQDATHSWASAKIPNKDTVFIEEQPFYGTATVSSNNSIVFNINPDRFNTMEKDQYDQLEFWVRPSLEYYEQASISKYRIIIKFLGELSNETPYYGDSGFGGGGGDDYDGDGPAPPPPAGGGDGGSGGGASGGGASGGGGSGGGGSGGGGSDGGGSGGGGSGGGGSGGGGSETYYDITYSDLLPSDVANLTPTIPSDIANASNVGINFTDSNDNSYIGSLGVFIHNSSATDRTYYMIISQTASFIHMRDDVENDGYNGLRFAIKDSNGTTYYSLESDSMQSVQSLASNMSAGTYMITITSPTAANLEHHFRLYNSQRFEILPTFYFVPSGGGY